MEWMKEERKSSFVFQNGKENEKRKKGSEKKVRIAKGYKFFVEILVVK